MDSTVTQSASADAASSGSVTATTSSRNHQEFAKEYLSSLVDLTYNSKPLIDMLTILAEENVEHGQVIVDAVEQHISKVSTEYKLPVLYLIDSIVKNVGHEYTALFSHSIVNIFCGVFEKVNEKVRTKMYALRQTWNDVFSQPKLYALDLKVNTIDRAWPITAKVAPAIHVNPNFLKPQPQQQQQQPEKDLQAQLLDKQRELLELQKMAKKLAVEDEMKQRLLLQQQQRMQQSAAADVEARFSPTPPELSQHQRPMAAHMMGRNNVQQPNANPNRVRVAPVNPAMLARARDPRLARIQAQQQHQQQQHQQQQHQQQMQQQQQQMQQHQHHMMQQQQQQQHQHHQMMSAAVVPPASALASTVPSYTATAPAKLLNGSQNPFAQQRQQQAAQQQTNASASASASSIQEQILADLEGQIAGRTPRELKQRIAHKSPPSAARLAGSAAATAAAASGRSADGRSGKSASSSSQSSRAVGSSKGASSSSSSGKSSSRDRDRGSSSRSGAAGDYKSTSTSRQRSNDEHRGGGGGKKTRTSSTSSSTSPSKKSPKRGSSSDRKSVSQSPSRSTAAPPAASAAAPTQAQAKSSLAEKYRSYLERNRDKSGSPTGSLQREDVAAASASIGSVISETTPFSNNNALLLESINSNGIDAAMVLEIAAKMKRMSEEQNAVDSDQPLNKKTKSEMDVLFGSEDVDLRQLMNPAVLGPIGAPSSTASDSDTTNVDSSPTKLDMVRAKIAAAANATTTGRAAIQLDMDMRPQQMAAAAAAVVAAAASASASTSAVATLKRKNDDAQLTATSDDNDDDDELSSIGSGCDSPRSTTTNNPATTVPVATASKRDRSDSQTATQGGGDKKSPRRAGDQQRQRKSKWSAPEQMDAAQALAAQAAAASVLLEMPAQMPVQMPAQMLVAQQQQQQLLQPPIVGLPPAFDLMPPQLGLPAVLPGVLPAMQQQPPQIGGGLWPAGALPPPSAVGVLPPMMWQQPPPNLQQPPQLQPPQQMLPTLGIGMPGVPQFAPIAPPAFVPHLVEQPRPAIGPDAASSAAPARSHSITIDNISREIRYYGETAIAFMGPQEPRELGFNAGERVVRVDQKDAIRLVFNDAYTPFTIDGRTVQIRFGTPMRELYINQQWYECLFGEPSYVQLVDGGGRRLLFEVEGPSPQVRIGALRRDLCAGRVDLYVDSMHKMTFFLDAQPQPFELDGQVHTLQFFDYFLTAMIDGQVFPQVQYGGMPKRMRIGQRERFIRFSVLPEGLQAGKVYVRGMQRTDRHRGMASPVPQAMTEVVAAPAAAPAGFQLPSGLANVLAGQSSSSSAAAAAPAIPALSINDLLQKLVASGIIDTANSKSNDGTQSQSNKPGSPALAAATPVGTPIDFARAETIKQRQAAHVEVLFAGLQCSSCGIRFPADQKKKYSQHLDWHFKQNRRDRDLAKRAHSRRWFCDVAEWVKYEEPEADSEEREKSWFEQQQADLGADLGTQAVGGGAAGEDSGAGGAEALPSCVADGDEDVDRTCDMCHDRFETFYNEETEDWHLRNAVREESGTFHPICWKDYLASLTLDESGMKKSGGAGIEDGDGDNAVDMLMKRDDGDDTDANIVNLDDDDDVIVLPAEDPIITEIADDLDASDATARCGSPTPHDDGQLGEATAFSTPAAKAPRGNYEPVGNESDLHILVPQISVLDLDEIVEKTAEERAALDEAAAAAAAAQPVRIKPEPRNKGYSDEHEEEDDGFEEVGTIESAAIDDDSADILLQEIVDSTNEQQLQQQQPIAIASPAPADTAAAAPDAQATVDMDGNIQPVGVAAAQPSSAANKIRINITKNVSNKIIINSSENHTEKQQQQHHHHNSQQQPSASEVNATDSGSNQLHFNNNGGGDGASHFADGQATDAHHHQYPHHYAQDGTYTGGHQDEAMLQHGMNPAQMAAPEPEPEPEIEFEVKESMRGLAFERMPPVRSGVDASGLCSIM